VFFAGRDRIRPVAARLSIRRGPSNNFQSPTVRSTPCAPHALASGSPSATFRRLPEPHTPSSSRTHLSARRSNDSPLILRPIIRRARTGYPPGALAPSVVSQAALYTPRSSRQGHCTPCRVPSQQRDVFVSHARIIFRTIVSAASSSSDCRIAPSRCPVASRRGKRRDPGTGPRSATARHNWAKASQPESPVPIPLSPTYGARPSQPGDDLNEMLNPK